jgi:hypothetical protein
MCCRVVDRNMNKELDFQIDLQVTSFYLDVASNLSNPLMHMRTSETQMYPTFT